MSLVRKDLVAFFLATLYLDTIPATRTLRNFPEIGDFHGGQWCVNGVILEQMCQLCQGSVRHFLRVMDVYLLKSEPEIIAPAVNDLILTL